MGLIGWLKKQRGKNKSRIFIDDAVESFNWSSGDVSMFVSETADLTVSEMKKVVKPVEVVDKLYDDGVRVDMSNIDSKLKLLKKRLNCMKELEVASGVSETKQAIRWLNNRKKLKKYYKEFRWHATTQEKIDQLLDKYALEIGSISGYHRVVPPEALDVIEEYVALHKKITNVAPKIKLIMEHAEEKKDPILLGSSPFGNFWFILGAWDKEAKLMKQLYKGLY